MIFFKVLPRSDPVNHRKQAGRLQRCQNTVPSAAMKIYGLPGLGAKGTRHAGHAGIICGNNDQKPMLGHRYKALAALWVTFDKFKFVRQ